MIKGVTVAFRRSMAFLMMARQGGLDELREALWQSHSKVRVKSSVDDDDDLNQSNKPLK
jgi:hypothetical protein